MAPDWLRTAAAYSSLLFFFYYLPFPHHTECVESAWGEICDIVCEVWSLGCTATLYWFSLTPRHLEVFPHGAQDRAGHGIYRRGSDWELPGPRPSQDAGGRQYSTGRSSCLSIFRCSIKLNQVLSSFFFFFILSVSSFILWVGTKHWSSKCNSSVVCTACGDLAQI